MSIAEQATTSLGAGSVTLFTFIGHAYGYLPGTIAIIGGLVGIIWYSIAIFESETFKAWRKRRAEHKIKRLRAKIAAYEKLK